MLDEVCARTAREEIFAITGLRFLEINTLVQLAALRKRSPESLLVAKRLLLIADLVGFYLSGRAVAERTLASTTQLLDARRREWSLELAGDQGIPASILPELVDPGTVLAPLREDLSRAAGFASPPPVIAVAGHDTASAVAAVPATGDGAWGYVSSGTWSLVGVELEEPCLEPQVLERSFTNELGAFGTTRFLQSVGGLWLVQECRRQWEREGSPLDYDELAELAAAAPPAQAWLDLDRPVFFATRDMPRAIRDHCRETGQPVPRTRGDVLRTALESLARAYLLAIRDAERLTRRRIERLHIVGGGSRQRLLDQLAANALRVPVVAGPVEATALGNMLVQAYALGDVGSHREMREIVARSSALQTFEPRG
jgi:rhamnulokinase